MPKYDTLGRILERAREKLGMTRDAFARFLELGNGKKIGAFYNAILCAHRNFPKKKLPNLMAICELSQEDAELLLGMRQLRMRKLMLPDINLSENDLLRMVDIVKGVGSSVPLKVLLERLPELQKRGR
ncbi:MAG: hypothetical protein AAB458_01885 [Patescibacteria group bacterium]